MLSSESMKKDVKRFPIEDVRIDLIDHGSFAMRHEHDYRDEMSLHDLQESIDKEGLLEPIGLRKKGKRFEIVFGHRRYEACKNLGWETITASILKGSDFEMRILAHAENSNREDVSFIEQEDYVLGTFEEGKRTGECKTIAALAKKLRKSDSYVSRFIAAAEFRKKHGIHQDVSTTSIRQVASPSIDEEVAKHLLGQLAAEEIDTRKLEATADSLRRLPKEVQKAVVLERAFPLQKATTKWKADGILMGADKFIEGMKKDSPSAQIDPTLEHIKRVYDGMAKIDLEFLKGLPSDTEKQKAIRWIDRIRKSATKLLDKKDDLGIEASRFSEVF